MGWDLLVWLGPIAVWAGRRNRFMRGLMAFCGLYLAAWFCTGVVVRFLTVLAPLLCLLAGHGLYALWGLLGRRGKAALAAAAAILVATHLLLFCYVHVVFGDPRVLLGLESREEFLSRRLEYYPCASWAREHLDKNDKILLVGEQRGYYVEQDVTATTITAPNRCLLWADEAAGPEALARRIRGEGYAHVLFVPVEFRRLLRGSFTERGLKNWEGLGRGPGGTVFRGPACALYSVAEPKP